MLNWLSPLWVINNFLVCYWSGAASIAASVIGGAMGDDAASTAADAQVQSSQLSNAELARQYNQNRADLAPYREAGTSSLNKIATLLGLKTGNASDSSYGALTKKFSQDDLNNDVVYQNGLKFGLDTGTNAIENRARASGSSDSGSVLKALLQYGNDYGTTKANDAYNRDTNYKSSLYNMLSGTAGTGQTATNTGVTAGNSLARATASNINDAGNARSAGIIGGANAWSKAAGQIGNLDWNKIINGATA